MTEANMPRWGLTTVLAMLVAAPLFAQSRPVRIYVFAAEAKFSDDAFRDRADSVKDLQHALSAKDSEVALVGSAAEADLTLEVLRRRRSGDTVATAYANPLWGAPRVCPCLKATLWVKVAIGDDSMEMRDDAGTARVREWSEAARNLAKQLVRWIKDNDARIPRK